MSPDANTISYMFKACRRLSENTDVKANEVSGCEFWRDLIGVVGVDSSFVGKVLAKEMSAHSSLKNVQRETSQYEAKSVAKRWMSERFCIVVMYEIVATTAEYMAPFYCCCASFVQRREQGKSVGNSAHGMGSFVCCACGPC